MQALSPRERQVILLVARGYTRIQAGQELGLSFSTVNAHAAKAYSKLGVHNANQALLVCAREGILDFEQGERTDELELLTKVLALTRSLIAALDDGRRPRKRQLRSASLTSYLAALDALLAARRDPAARDAARAQMAAALGLSPGADTRKPTNGALGALIAEVLDS